MPPPAPRAAPPHPPAPPRRAAAGGRGSGPGSGGMPRNGRANSYGNRSLMTRAVVEDGPDGGDRQRPPEKLAEMFGRGPANPLLDVGTNRTEARFKGDQDTLDLALRLALCLAL